MVFLWFTKVLVITRGYLGTSPASPHPVTWLAPGPAESSMLKRNVFLEPKKSTVMDLEREIEDFSEAKMGRSGDLAQAKMRIH